jgi:sulfide:quinone oxidoreductase
MDARRDDREALEVVIAGGGVAALEAALALRELAGERVRTTLLAPDPDFHYRPTSVREPFGLTGGQRYRLADIAADLGLELVAERLKWVDHAARAVHTDAGSKLSYDALLLALGASRYERFPLALTIDDERLDEQLCGLVQDVEQGYVHSVAFLIPERMPWPFPVYELALMTAARAYEMGVELAVTVLTLEPAPLAIFGAEASRAVARRLAEHRIETITSVSCEVREPGTVSIHPGGRELLADRLIALPELHGPRVPGIPLGPRGGFIPIDPYGRVKRLQRVFAAGDATDFPIKLGGVAAQQADTAAESIAALAGAAVTPRPLRAEIEGLLLGGGPPLRLSASATGSFGCNSRVEVVAHASPLIKIFAKHLTPYLNTRSAALSPR